ncbi:hypothetical protein LTR95_011883 [Oleoguttula sp. CCFEE 5521]
MHLSTASILLTSLTLATAQTSTSTSTSFPSLHTGHFAPTICGPQIDGIIQTCLINSNINLRLCSASDPACLCDKATAVADCYLNCPFAPRQDALIDRKNAYCDDAAAAASSQAVGGAATTVTATSASVITEVSWTTRNGITEVFFSPVTKIGDVRVTATSEAGAGKVGAGVVSGGGVVGLLLGWVALL